MLQGEAWGALVMADRGLAHRRGIRHVIQHGADVVLCMSWISVPLDDSFAYAQHSGLPIPAC